MYSSIDQRPAKQPATNGGEVTSPQTCTQVVPKAIDQFQVQFWGVRGSIACPGKDTVRYGGNTSCVEMRVGGQRLIFDAGTGIRLLGDQIIAESTTNSVGHIFFSHSHWDHIQGFPFFSPAFVPGNRFDIYGGLTPNGITIKERLNNQMMDPNFPVPLKVMGAEMHFHNLEVDEVIQLGDVTVTSAALNHPGSATGYRVSYGGRSAAYVTDTEHRLGELDADVLKLAQDADLFIYDCTYTDDEYGHPTNGKAGWGHSTWQQGVRLAQAAGVKQLAIFHHDPSHNDAFMDEIARSAGELFSGAIVAQEGRICDLS
jgi:phosphoribosyl 1,2-cyclic phosphodiesterase